MVAAKRPGEREVLCLDYDAFSAPLPELFLSGPEFFSVSANDERRFLLLLLLVFSRHPLFRLRDPWSSTTFKANAFAPRILAGTVPVWGLKSKEVSRNNSGGFSLIFEALVRLSPSEP